MGIHQDPVTKQSKGFGFVSYATTAAATLAIKGMNGFDTKHGKFLKVTIKKGEEQYNPDAVAAQNAAIATTPVMGSSQANTVVGVAPTVAMGVSSSELAEAANKGNMVK